MFIAAGTGAAGLFFSRDQIAGGFGQIVEPEYYLWAWRREEDLSFIDPSRQKLALWTATITLDHDEFIVEYRTNQITYPSEAEIVSVVRLEATGVPGAATTAQLADAIIGAGRPFAPVEHQLDFDARLSQRNFYRHLLGETAETHWRRETLDHRVGFLVLLRRLDRRSAGRCGCADDLPHGARRGSDTPHAARAAEVSQSHLRRQCRVFL